jgi:hypothetical protein
VEDALAALLLALDPLPVRADSFRRPGLHVAEDVRMAADELLVHAARDRGEVAGAALGEQERQEVDLEQQVAELVEQLPVVGGKGGVRDLVRLLDRVRDDRLRRLLAIPRAVAAQTLRQLLKLDKGLREALLHLTASSWWWPRRWWTSPSSPPAGSPPGSGPCP